MTREAIYETLENLSYTRGSYGRLLRNLCEMRETDEERFEEIMTCWEENCSDAVELVIMIEGG